MELRLKFFICFQKFKGQTGFNLFLTILQNHLIIYVVKQVTSALCSFSFFDASSLTASDRTSVTCGFYCLSFSNIDLLHNLHYDRGRSCLFCRFQSKSLRIFLIFEFLNFCLFWFNFIFIRRTKFDGFANHLNTFYDKLDWILLTFCGFFQTRSLTRIRCYKTHGTGNSLSHYFFFALRWRCSFISFIFCTNTLRLSCTQVLSWAKHYL
jgi:hypothetical protein